MEPRLLYLIVVLAAASGILGLLRMGRTRGMFTGGRPNLPRDFVVEPVEARCIPRDAAQPISFLADKLASLGFTPADGPVRVPSLDRLGYRLILAAFVHLEERTFFLLATEAGPRSHAQLMLHIVTPLVDERRVETTTLALLETLSRPPKVEVQVVPDAYSIEELWSRHRRALGRHQRAERAVVTAEVWRHHAAASYEAWIQTGVRAQRLMLEPNGRMYRVRPRPKSVV